MNKTARYVLVTSGPSSAGRSVRCVIRELFTDKTRNVTFAEFEKLKQAGRIERPAFIPKEKRP